MGYNWGLCGVRVNPFFFYHPAGDPFVYFNGVLVGEELGNENALPAF